MSLSRGKVSIFAVAFAAGAALLLHISAEARQGNETNANMQVSANVIRKCTLTTQPLAFGSYDPVQTNANAPLDGQSTLTVACTKGTAVNVAMDAGANAQGPARRMSGAGGEYLPYELYKDSSRTEVWGAAGGEMLNGGVAPSRDPRQFIVYGRVPGGQDVAVGAFQDTVLVTVQF